MEPFPKRQRLFAPAHRDSTLSFGDQHAYHDDIADSEMLDEEEELEDEKIQESDPDAELEQRRARLDYKLKSTFEAIFEKYGKDFDGIGDEIDLATGEILVDNGHLHDMTNERDAGDVSRSRHVLEAFSTGSDDLASSSIGETDIIDEEDNDDDDDDEEGGESTSDDDMVDDDMILRGFAKANRFVQASPELEASPDLQSQEHHYGEDWRSNTRGSALPSRSDILLQFGPQLGPHIAEYISQQHAPDSPAPDDSEIEPAWRVPRISFSRPVKRYSKNLVNLPSELERSPSPEAARSIWAPAKSHVRRGAEKVRKLPKRVHEALMIDPLNNPVGFQYDQVAGLKPKRIRKNFTAQDDQILLHFVKQARRQNLELSSIATWRRLEDMHPNHSSTAWKGRYNLKFTYLWPNESEELETSETSVDTTRRMEQPNSIMEPSMNERPATMRSPVHTRPSRIRKPVAKDSRIISWSQAVDAIELIDPDLHAGILEDSRILENDRGLKHNLSSSFDQDAAILRAGPDSLPQSKGSIPFSQHDNNRIPNVRRPGEISSDFMVVDSAPRSGQSIIPCAPCPHAACKGLSLNTYRLQRQEEEDLSEMCLHLYHQHHTTPFPCCEINCSRKGEEGFFMQADLVRHVRLSHTSIDALERLRGRVNSELLNRHIDVLRPLEQIQSPVKAKSHLQSDVMSPLRVQRSIPDSNAQFSSSSRGGRTVTPHRTSMARKGADSTPMTSISSLLVHPSSGNTVLPVRNGHSYDSLRLGKAETSIEDDATVELHSDGHMNHDTNPSVTPAQVLGTRQLSDPFGSDPARRSLPTPQASLGGSLGPSSGIPQNSGTRRLRTEGDRPVAVMMDKSGSKEHISASVVDSQESLATLPSSSFGPPSNHKAENPARISDSFFRPVDPSYAFSDEEDGPFISKPMTNKVPKQAGTADEVSGKSAKASPIQGKSRIPTKQPQVLSPFKIASRLHAIKSSAIRSTPDHSNTTGLSKTRAMLPPSTPAENARAQLRKSVIPELEDDDDFDELSSEQFGILTRPRTNPQSKTHSILARVRKGGNAKSPQVHSAPPRKRKLSSFQEPAVNAAANSMAQEAIAKATPSLQHVELSDPAIKDEVDESTALSALPKQYGRLHDISVVPVEANKSPFRKQLDRGTRTGTPLLDLTPNHNKAKSEVRDTDDGSSSPLVAAASRSTVELGAGIGTPIQSRRVAKAWNKAPIVLRTPGGTFKKCGEDGFRCRKGFCFACGAESKARSTRKGKGKEV